MLEVGAAMTWALFVVSSKKLLGSQKPLETLVQVFLVAAVILTPILFFVEPVSLETLLAIAGLGVFTTAMAYALYYEALKRVSAITGILLFSLSLFFAILLGSVLLNETLAPIGIMLSRKKPTKSTSKRTRQPAV